MDESTLLDIHTRIYKMLEQNIYPLYVVAKCPFCDSANISIIRNRTQLLNLENRKIICKYCRKKFKIVYKIKPRGYKNTLFPDITLIDITTNLKDARRLAKKINENIMANG